MDLLGSYDSEGDLSDSNSNGKNHTNDATHCDKELQNTDLSHAARSLLFNASNGKNLGPFKKHKVDDITLLKTDFDDSSTKLSSRVHAEYYKSKISASRNPKDHETAGHVTNTALKGETVLYSAPKTGELSILGVEIGSRTSESIILSQFDNFTPELEQDKPSLEGKQDKTSKALVREHARNHEDVLEVNYSVDHPSYKSASSIVQNALAITEGRSILPLAFESVGGVYSTPSGISEKIYYNDVSFQNEILKNDLLIAQSHEDRNVDLKRRRRLTQSEIHSEDIFGPWIPFEEGELPVPSPAVSEPTEKEKDSAKTKTRDTGVALPRVNPSDALDRNEVIVDDGKQHTKFNGIVVSTFHKKIDPDRTYSSWVIPPKNAKVADVNTYKAGLPKQEIHTYVGHSMAVQKILYFPKTGHYLLSASMDGFVKIWDSNNNRRCVRTYKGHCKGVRDINFASDDGNRFFSCGFDSTVIQWDTEYGKITGVYPIDKTPYCVTVHPTDENVFIVGGENKKACQFDARSGNIVLEYSEHLGCVNTVTFIDNNRKILTTADDKKMLVWEYNVPVVVKHIGNPSMHSVPAVVTHPSDKFVLGQSMDNQIVVYESSGSRFKFYGRKKFRGHQNSGYAIKPSCSPDGKFIASGDSRGKIFIWDWKTCRSLQTLTGHKAVTMDCKWHPTQTSRLATCSWDGTIKLWD
ncbi:pre-mRNA splicing factor, putative [Theileria equi strain WA]|uniref:Pre-mRNA-processing factor 17 n=1 Tax=Theileria equi strain WA TaxID=1537102 RepID=L0AUT3_THEEQ|nr:pre-mRNA splicing factor, putative [Theileria equi strain WA]AFZ79305.1 pre-mRNA splicing factor, putative [Theileria equi strain WA]|eukprot:XP_004828971.1 pre-mRNA splicing factor, putative [Theileria equi strain WA]